MYKIGLLSWKLRHKGWCIYIWNISGFLWANQFCHTIILCIVTVQSVLPWALTLSSPHMISLSSSHIFNLFFCRLHESLWRQKSPSSPGSGDKVTREMLMVALQNVQHILIRASDSVDFSRAV